MIDIRNCDAMELLRSLETGSVSLVLTDPPYNIGKAKWDKIKDYVPWLVDIFVECERVTRDAGQLIFWHNDPVQIAELIHTMHARTRWVLRSFITMNKPLCRNFIGGDINAEYCKIARAQVAAITPTFSQL